MDQEFENFTFILDPAGSYVQCQICGAWDWDFDNFANLKLLIDSIKEHVYNDCKKE